MRIFDKDIKRLGEKFIDVEKLDKGKIRLRVHARNGYKSLVLAPQDIKGLIDLMQEHIDSVSTK